MKIKPTNLFSSRQWVNLLVLIAVVLGACQAQAQHTLLAHFAFDTTDEFNDVGGADSSTNGYDLTFGAGISGGGVLVTNDVAAGPLAIDFFPGPNNNGFGMLGWSTTPPSLLSALAGSFTVSCWIKTTQNVGGPGDPAWADAGIVAADVSGGAYDVVPIGLTGGAIGFTTGEGPSGDDDTVTSMNQNVNDGYYHLITVTRDQSTGLKIIYIDGLLDNSDYGVTNSLSDPRQIDIGCVGNGGDPNPGDLGFYNGYDGEFDDLQIYSGVLDAAEVMYLDQNPGLTVADTTTGPTTTVPNLVAHYAFDSSDNIGLDTSGRGNDLDYNSTAAGGGGVFFDEYSEAGAGAAYFDGGSFLSYSSLPAEIRETLGGSFTLSVWISTTTIYGSDGDPAWVDPGIVAADIPGTANDIVPMSVTGTGIGFGSGGPNFDDDLNAYTDVTDGNYHHIVVTRDQATGVKQIYIDGALTANDTAAPQYLHDPVEVAVGSQIDASQTNPDNAFYGASSRAVYQGWMDDMQIYNRVLSCGEINFLYQNPGQVVTGAPTASVEANVTFSFYRETDPVDGDYYLCFPDVSVQNGFDPDLVTLFSPNGTFGFNGGGYSYGISAVEDVVSEFADGYWTLAFNTGETNEQVFHFQASISGLDSDSIPAVDILVPTYNAINVPNNTPFQWNGPTNFDYINASVVADAQQSYTNFSDPTVTEWPSPPVIPSGTNHFDIVYTMNGFPGVTTGTPMDSLQSSVFDWSVDSSLNSEENSTFFAGGGVPTQVTLVRVGQVTGGLQFSFFSQSGTSNIVQSSTNLANPTNWVTVTNFAGNGSVWQFVVPTTNAPAQFFRVETQSQ